MRNEAISDIFAGLGHVEIRRMFGGSGIFHNSLIVGLEVDGEVLLKADKESAPDFAAAGSVQWIYEGKRKPIAMPYWSIPDEAIDDTDVLARWTTLAYEAARRCAK